MNQKNNEFREFFKKVKALDNRLNLYSQKLNLYSILPSYILSTVFFKSNNDLKYFIESVFRKNYFKDYIYLNRTLLLSRFIRDLNDLTDKEILININDFIYNHTKEYYINPNKEYLIDLYNKYSRNRSDL